MATAVTIDELVVVLGMDSSKFTEEQKKALASFKKTQEASEQTGKNIEEHWRKISDVFGVVKRGAIGIVAAFAGEEAARAIDHIAGMDNATGKMAKTIGIGISGLSEWQGMIRMIGGEAGSATSALAGLQDAIQAVKAGKGYFSGAASSIFNAMGVNPLTSSPDAILKAATAYFEKEIGSNRMSIPYAAGRLNDIPGMNKDMIDLILKGANEQRRLADAARAAGLATAGSVAASDDYTKKVTEFKLSMENLARVTLPLATVVAKVAAAFGGIVNNALNWTSLSDDEKKRRDDMERASEEHWAAVRRRAAARSGGGYVDSFMRSTPGSAALRTKAGAGVFSPEVSALASMIQQEEPGLRQFTAANDAYHAGTDSKHAKGLALDFVVNDPAQAGAVVQRLRERLKNMGVGAKVLDEYSRPSGRSTAPHIHVQFDDAGSAARFTGARGAAAVNNFSNSRSGGDTNSTSSVSIGQLNVNAPRAENADGIAREMAPAIKRSSMAMPANYANV